MRRALLGSAFASVLAAAPPPAYAGFYTGNDLYQLCSEPEGSALHAARDARCAGYVSAVWDQLNLMQALGVALPLVAKGTKICPADSITVGQVRDVAVQALRDHPGDRHLSASALVITALTAAFKC